MAEAHIPSIAVLASGNGSTVEDLVRDIDKGILKAEVGLVICNNKPGDDVQVYKRMHGLNEELGTDIKTLRISGATHPRREKEKVNKGEMTEEEAEAIATILGVGKFTLLLLAGSMKKVHPLVVQEWGTIPEHTSPFQAHALNTHPALLPLTKGMIGAKACAEVVAKNEPYNYHTVHTVSAEYDDGFIIAQNKVPVLPHYDGDQLFIATQKIEKANLAVDIGWFLAQQVRWEAGETDIEFAMAA